MHATKNGKTILLFDVDCGRGKDIGERLYGKGGQRQNTKDLLCLNFDLKKILHKKLYERG